MYEPKNIEPLRVLVRKANCIPDGKSVSFFVPRRAGSAYPWGLATVPASAVHDFDGSLGGEMTGKYAAIMLDVNDRHKVETRDSGSGKAIDSEWMSAYEILGALLKAELDKTVPVVRTTDENTMFLKFRTSGLAFEAYVSKLKAGAIDLTGKPQVAVNYASNGCGIT